MSLGTELMVKGMAGNKDDLNSPVYSEDGKVFLRSDSFEIHHVDDKTTVVFKYKGGEVYHMDFFSMAGDVILIQGLSILTEAKLEHS